MGKILYEILGESRYCKQRDQHYHKRFVYVHGIDCVYSKEGRDFSETLRACKCPGRIGWTPEDKTCDCVDMTKKTVLS